MLSRDFDLRGVTPWGRSAARSTKRFGGRNCGYWLAVSPCVWVPVLMEDGDYFSAGHADGEIHGIGESLEQAPPNPRINFRKLKRVSPNTIQNVIQFIEKADPQTRPLVLVSTHCVGDI